ncbi:MAG: arsenate reductase ArsC [Gemmatimonadetes bacterium]|nr:arsenate reductase ArsC [Gemmatimonadota bacterium]
MSDARPPFRILVLCTGNSARSQIAEAIIATRGLKRPLGQVVAESAGSKPAAKVNEYAIVALQNHGIEWRGRTPKSIDSLAGQQFDLVITVCDHARDACPFFAGAKAQVHWGLTDPAEHISPATARAAFAQTYEALFQRVNRLLRLPLEEMDAVKLTVEAQAIHDTLTAPARRSSARLRRPS